MNKHDHKHKCTCDHEKVRYCKTCLLVHCLDCGQEWSQHSRWTYTPYWSTYTVKSNDYQNPQITWTSPNTLGSTQTLTSSCKHGD